jgi:malonyl-CoA decarboxylase
MAHTGLLDRTLGHLLGVWREVAERAGLAERQIRDPDLTPDDETLIRSRFQTCLEAKGGEISARARAAELGRAYLTLSRTGRERFLRVLARDFAVDRQRLIAAAEAYRVAGDARTVRKAERKLRDAAAAPRIKLLTQFTTLPDGIKFLVDLRADLIEAIGDNSDLADMDEDLRSLLAAWFDVGFLELRRITWESPAALLEKVKTYEAVHQVRSWDDLKNRLDADRRCYGFFHPRMASEPLIFVEVALVKGMASNVQGLLDESAPLLDPATADTAIFYSISNTQTGLRGIGFGNFLIKQVVEDLARDFPRLDRFATLSPAPGFRPWLSGLPLAEAYGFLPGDEAGDLRALAAAQGGGEDFRGVLAAPWWNTETGIADRVRQPLLRLAAVYLLTQRRNDRPLDPVARFHLGNGASVERLNWLADTSEKGMAESFGLMVNYGYRSADIESNHEIYASGGPVPATSVMKKLIAGIPTAKRGKGA